MMKGGKMAKNRNNTLANEHHLICGQSGSGKTTFVRQDADLKASKRVLFWDPYHDHDCPKRFDNAVDFKRFLAGALRRGIGFRVALSIEAPPEVMCQKLDEFYDIAWMIADGNKKTCLVVEEIADGYDTIAKAKGRGGQVFRAGRSFGLKIYALTQSVSEIPKTIVKQCGSKVVFYHNDYSDLKRAGELAGQPPDEICGLQTGEYFIRQAGALAGEKRRTKKLAAPKRERRRKKST
jgi:energy-coupling factor transporter ATP-binding protein EcfA2